jgi:hypothetical protein
MVNKIYIDQIAYKMNRAKKDGYEDTTKSAAALLWMVEKIESRLNKCLNVENGNCNMTWRHDDCLVLMELLYDLTNDEKYAEKPWIIDPNKMSLWD